MTTKEITIEKNVYDLDKSGNKQDFELSNGKIVTKMKKKSFEVKQIEINKDLFLIPEYPGYDKNNNFKARSAKLFGDATYIIDDKVKRELKFRSCGRKENFAFYIPVKHVEKLMEYLKTFKVGNGWVKKYISDNPTSYLAEKNGVAPKSKKGRAIKKVAAKGDKIQMEEQDEVIQAETFTAKIEAINKTSLSDADKKELIASLITQL